MLVACISVLHHVAKLFLFDRQVLFYLVWTVLPQLTNVFHAVGLDG